MESQLHVKGLSDLQVLRNRNLFGSNKLDYNEKTTLSVFKNILTEPMFLLLAATCVIYLIAGNTRDASLMAAGLIIISAISFFQERKSNNAINALRKLSAPKVSALRNGKNDFYPKRRDSMRGYHKT